MSDRMRPISFERMVNWIIGEVKAKGSIYGIHSDKIYYSKPENTISFLGETLGIPIGPAAGPNSQLAQNIVAAYLTGSRFIELKTVQILDGEDLPVSKPCIKAEDECYNVEWSTELRVEEAYEEYVKGWFLMHLLQKELGISDEKDFMFNMSVGYDLEGIKSNKINSFIENLKDGSSTTIWQECVQVLRDNLSKFTHFNEEALDRISPKICSSITLSTLHGCPPAEIERIATYLLKEKHLNTFIKMNPTLLGEEFVRDTFNAMGYGYITLNPHHFKNDLQYDDGIAMLRRLRGIAKDEDLNIGVKLTNTLPVKILNKELPGEEMYMSGRSLYPLTITLAKKLSNEFEGDLYISYSGGADFFNVDKLFETGICPITFATTLLKPGGYERINQLAKKLENLMGSKKQSIDTNLLNALAEAALSDPHHVKGARAVGNRKVESKLTLFGCATAPCSEGCPINQRIPEYISLVGEGNYDEAFKVIARDNPAPSITGTICNHNCQYKCTRLDYESSVEIRAMKKLAADKSQEKYTEEVKPSEIKTYKRACIIGAGAAGLATAAYLRRNGMEAEVFEKRQKPYGIINHVIPDFRIEEAAINRDFKTIESLGVKVNFGVNQSESLEKLKKDFDYVVLAVGAYKEGKVNLEEGSDKVLNAIKFLEQFKADKAALSLGNKVCVIGGGDVAMDAARAAGRVPGVEEVSIVYRRTRDFMPASKEEIDFAVEDGVLIKELLAPSKFDGETLVCEEMALGERDSSGRRKPVPTGNLVELPATALIAAVGEQVDAAYFEALGIKVTSKGLPEVSKTCETNIKDVYVAGDALKGPGTIVGAMGHGKTIAMDILRKESMACDLESGANKADELSGKALKDRNELYHRKGILTMPIEGNCEAERCLGCNKVCEVCTDVCPNRANVTVKVFADGEEAYEILHIDGMCNECGNCGVFCPHDGNPYKDKATVFWSLADLEDSSNIGFFVENLKKGIVIVRNEAGEVVKINLSEEGCKGCCERKNVSKEIVNLIAAVMKEHSYLL
ncbi:MAG: putative selenate reductase subunit YgfK [Clostridium sp.]